MHKTVKGTLWVLHSALNTFCLLLLSCQVVTRTTRFSPWKPSSWSCCLYSRLFWALCLPFPWWNSIWIFWHQQSQSPCHHSLQALKWRNGWFSEYRGGTCNLQIICKKHLFVISDDVTQDHDSVLHIQKLISKHFQDSKCVIKNMHEFTDRCAGQYKSGHYLGDLSCSLATLGCTVQRNFFATSHAKGEQGAAGSHVKQKATTAVLRRRVKLLSAQELCDFLTENFSGPAASSFLSRQKSVQLKRRVFFNLPFSGALAVSRNQEGGRFCTVKGIRQLRSVRTCSEQLKIFTRERACHDCLAERYNRCENTEWVDD